MVEKIIINPEQIRGYGNIINEKGTEDFTNHESEIELTTDTVSGQTVNVFELTPHIYEVSKVKLQLSDGSMRIGGTITLTATLTDAEDNAISGATITFTEENTTLGTGTTNSSGKVTCSYTAETAGLHTFKASFAGDSTYSSSVGSARILAYKLDTSTSLSSSSNSVRVGSSVTLTATVTSSSTPVSGLTVTFKDGNTTLGTSTTNSSGVATYTTSSLSVATHSMTAIVTETDTYATSTSNSVSVSVYDHLYTLAFGSDSYTATGGSATLGLTLLDEGVPVSGATVTVTGSDSSLYTGITNSQGVASVTVTGLTATATFTASYQNVTDTCTVTVISYIINDDATTNNRDTLFGASSIGLRNSGTSTMTWTSGSPSYYQVKVTKSSSDSFIEYLPLRGITDSFKMTIKYKLPSSSGVSYVGLYYYLDSNNWGGVKGLNDAQWVSSNTNGTFTEQEYTTGQSRNTNYYTHEIVYDKTANTLTISTYNSSDTLIQTKTMNIPVTLTSSVKWGNAAAWSNNDKNNIYLIKAEYL